MLYINMNDKEREALNTELDFTQDAKWYRRLKVIDLSSQAYSVPQLAHMFDLSKATIRNYIHTYQKGGLQGLKRQFSPGAPVKIPLTKDEMEDLVHQSPCQFDKLNTGARNWDQELIGLYFQEYHQIQVDQSSISKFLKRQKIHLNRGRLKVTSPDPEYKSKRQRIETLKKRPLMVS